MSERLLQFIWQFQYFNRSQLVTTTGESVQIIYPGFYNTNQGPDFTAARIRIGKTNWAGTVELHIKTSDWNKHQHQHDSNYNNVILHVVWEKDTLSNDIPVLELKNRVAGLLINRYEELMNAPSTIPCGSMIGTVPAIVWQQWKDRLLAERMANKSEAITRSLQQNNIHWEETCWWMLARNFGMTVNADTFEAVGRSISLTVLARHGHSIKQLEAILFGQAGLLEKEFSEPYPEALRKEYVFLQRKLGIHPVQQPLHFLRMRPGNFPTVRLAQLAMLLHRSVNLFTRIKDAVTINEIREIFSIAASDYWNEHYRLDEQTSFKKKKIGKAMIDSLVINTVVPLLFAYGNYHQEEKYKGKALQWLEQTGAETNSVTESFRQSGIQTINAYDSQALIELKTNYCMARKCLDCAIGNAILRKSE